MELLADISATAVNVAQPVLPMILLGGIMTLTYLAIAFDWLNKSLAALLGALVCVAVALALGVFRDEAGHSAYDRAVHEIIGHDLGVLGVIIGTSVLVEIVSRSGLFHFLAIKIVKITHGEPKLLLAAMAIATVLFVALLTIAPGALIMASLALVVTRELELDPKPYILTIALCANSGALMTFASGICTLMLGTAGNLEYAHFFLVTTPLAVVTAVIAWAMIAWMYRRSLKGTMTSAEREAKVASFDEWALVKDRRLFYRCTAILLATIVGFASARSLGIGLDFVAFAGATVALLASGIYPDEAIKKVNWSLILFFVGIFVIIGSVQETGLLAWQAEKMVELSGGEGLGVMMILGSFVLTVGGVMDNIPVAATMIPIVRSMEAQGLAADPLWWTLVVTSNLSGNTTPIGSVSSVIALGALEKERGIRIGWGEFLKVGCAALVIQSIVALGYLAVFYLFDLFP